jgi:hypothetical protein
MRGNGDTVSILFYFNSYRLSKGNVVAHDYNLQEVAALFLEENLVHAEHFVSELVYIK